MRIASTIGATSVNHDGVDYEADEDGTFEVPEAVGLALVRFPEWLREHEALDLKLAAEAEAAKDPDQVAARLAALEADNAALRAELAALKAPAKQPAKKAPARKAAAGS